MPIPEDGRLTGRALLRDDVYLRVRDRIIDGTFAPGEQLKDGELAEWLGVSRTPVREALLRLGQSGLVESRPGRSTVVSSLDVRAAREARDVVAAMHALAAHEAVGVLTDAHVRQMRDAAERFSGALRRGDIAAALEADDELHGIPVEAAGNRAIAAVLDQYMPLLRRLERIRFSTVDGERSPDRHTEFIELCAAGDVGGAAAVAFETWNSLPITVD